MRRRAAVAGVFVLVTAVVFAFAQAWFVGAVAEPSPSVEDEFAARVASARSSASVPGYVVAADLVEVARRHAEEMVRQQRLHHNPRLADEVSGWQSVGENVGVGGSVDEIHDAFMASASHRDAILSSTFTEVGVGVVVSGPDIWVAQVFRQPEAAPAPAPSPAPAAAPSDARGRVRSARVGAASASPVPVAPAAPDAPGAAAPPTTVAAPPVTAVPFDTSELDAAFTAARVASVAPRPIAISSPSPSRDSTGADPRDVTLPVVVAASMLVLVVGALTVHVGTSRVRAAADPTSLRSSSVVDAWELALAA